MISTLGAAGRQECERQGHRQDPRYVQLLCNIANREHVHQVWHALDPTTDYVHYNLLFYQNEILLRGLISSRDFVVLDIFPSNEQTS